MLSTFLTGILATAALGASLTQVSNYNNNATSKAQMYIYVPDNVVTNPPLVVVLHSCQSSAQSYFTNNKIPWKQGSDKKGYITIWPSSPNSGTCWDVSSKQSLSHLGGGDSQAIASMILYALDHYKADASRVYVTGGSSGAMMSNVLAATHPELISAVSLYSGVPAGCFVSSSGGIAQWNNTCSGGQIKATADKWKQVVLDMYPGYTGARPKMQVWHGSVDSTLAPANYEETIKQWTGVFGVSQTATATKADTPQGGYTTSDYGSSVEGIYAQGVGHSVPANLTASEIWFGL
ncbi:acetylxylan esteras-like protein 1 precursor [Pseudomassariella vexata]|uniref:Carboxylic ester hydrolase n=1 Tax=Pseudomassariella vexata TaxID=1141098 RepID=A0A1Y2DXZ1_9PEZI|nr:acetylxylan esteras-like protein 1 precursor [Pseudomassariella vexata]ORY64168.1 acetylxylan esteras-like protein 1 precursor [Pseudomassariella vexata]